MRLVLLSLLLTPIAAYADPGTIVAWVAINWVTVAQVALTVAVSVYGSAQQRKKERRAKEQYNAGLQDRLITRVATEAPHVYVYGRAKVGSAVVAIFTSGNKDQYKHLVCVHAAHECDAFEEIYVANKALGALDANGWVTTGEYVTVTTEHALEIKETDTFTLAHTPISGTVSVIESGEGETRARGIRRSVAVVGANVTVLNWGGARLSVRYQYHVHTPRVRVSRHLGTATDPADAYLMSVVPGKWTSAHVLRGFCYTVITLDLNQPEFQGGIPEIHVLLRGKKLYDPRTGTRAWSQNNALVAYDYLTGPCCNVDAADLPVADYITAANVCDESYSFGKRYTFNGTITSDEDRGPVLERIAQSMAGGIVSTTWSLYAGKYVAPVMALEQSDIVGSLAITPGMSDADIYNTVRGQFISAETDYIATDYKPYQNAVYRAADEKELATNIDLPYTDTTQRVHNLCRIFTEDQRNGYTVKGGFSRKTWALQIGQRVTLNSALFGWNDKVFRVTDKSYSPSQAVELTLKEDAASIWDFADAVTVDSTPNSDLLNPFAINSISGLSCESGADALLIQQDGTIISRILATWSQSDNPYVNANGQIELQWQKEGSDTWQTVNARGDETSAYLSPVEDGAVYTVRIRASIPSMGTRSDWTYVLDHQVIGKTEPPANISDLSISGTSLSWTHVTDLDLRGYVFRFHYGNNMDWGTAVPLHAGYIASSPFDMTTLPGGVVTIMGKAVDWSGNESLATANIVTDLGDVPVANVVETIDFKATGFPGTIAGATIIGGDLVADFTDSFYGTGSQSFYGSDNDPVYDASSYDQLIYTSNEIQISSALAGSLMTIDIAMQGTDLYIEYRLTGPGSFYGPDSDSAYGSDSEAFYGGPGSWIPWPGQVAASNDAYQFRVTIGAGAVRGKITSLALIVDAPDMVEYLEDVPVSASGTVVPYTKNFAAIKTVTPTLQANASGAVTVEVDKTDPLNPILKAYNSSHVSVSGATSDVIVKGY